VQFQTRTQQPSVSELANASPIGITFITLFFPQKINTHTGIYP
jgi:hypothetical protein